MPFAAPAHIFPHKVPKQQGRLQADAGQDAGSEHVNSARAFLNSSSFTARAEVPQAGPRCARRSNRKRLWPALTHRHGIRLALQAAFLILRGAHALLQYAVIGPYECASDACGEGPNPNPGKSSLVPTSCPACGSHSCVRGRDVALPCLWWDLGAARCLGRVGCPLRAPLPHHRTPPYPHTARAALVFSSTEPRPLGFSALTLLHHRANRVLAIAGNKGYGPYRWDALLDADYGTPSGMATSTPGGVWTRTWSKAVVTLDCASWNATIAMK